MKIKESLKTKLERKSIVQAPGAYDALTAKIIASEGFEAVYMTGYGTSASFLGKPDMGFLTLTEMAANAGRIAEAVDVPVIADADTGYGNAVNITRTVREYEKGGVEAIHIEDQVWPKRCGHMAGKQVIPTAEMESKIRAAVDSRRSDDFLIIARTDAIAVEGFEAAIERGGRYAEAGADVLFIEAPTDREQLAEIPKQLPQKPHLANMAPRTPPCSVDELEAMGYAIVIYPGISLRAAISACRKQLRQLKETGRQENLEDWMKTFADLNNFLGADEYERLQKRYEAPDSG